MRQTEGQSTVPWTPSPQQPVSRRGAYAVARLAFPAHSRRAAPVRRAILKHTVRALFNALESTPMAGRVWLMGGIAIGYARTGEALHNDLVDMDFGYADADHDRMMATLEVLLDRGFVPKFRLESNAGVQTAMRLRRDGVWIDLLRCFRRSDREYWITYLTDRHGPSAPQDVEVETEVAFQEKIPTDPPLYGTTWLRAVDLPRYLAEQYGDWDAPDHVFYSRQWDHVRDSPAVVRCEPWSGSWEG